MQVYFLCPIVRVRDLITISNLRVDEQRAWRTFPKKFDWQGRRGLRLELREGPRSREGKVKPVPSLWGWGLDQRGHCHQRSCQSSQDGQSWDLSGGINLDQDFAGWAECW